MKLSLTGIKLPSIWARTTLGAAITLIGWPLSEHRRKRSETQKVCRYCNRWNRNTSRAFIGLDYPSCKERGHHVLPRDGS